MTKQGAFAGVTVPDFTEEIVVRCLEKVRKKYGDAAEIRAALHAAPPVFTGDVCFLHFERCSTENERIV